VVSVDTIFGAGSWVQADSHFVQGRRVDLACDASRWRERLLCLLVGNELELSRCQLFSTLCDNHVPDCTYRPEEASTSDITDVWMTVEVLVQELSQVLAVLADVLHQFLFLHDPLDLQCGCTAYRMTLVGVSMGKSTG